MRALERLFHPRGIAIVGAKQDLSQGGGLAFNALLSHGYSGQIYPINPKYREIAGARCYASLSDIEGPCDVAVIALPAGGVIEAVKACGARGVAYAIIHSALFRQTGEQGLAREIELVKAARRGGVRLIGPNCNGVVNVTDGVYSAFGSMARGANLASGPISMVYQSGGLGYGMVLKCASAGLGFRYLVASGNEADITTPELIDAYLDDPETRIVVAYIEGINNGRALMAAGRKAAELSKVVLVWKVGNTRHGKLAAASHTANMTGSYDVYRAAFRQAGIIEAHDLDEISDLAKAFACNRRPKGRNVAVMSSSGGAAIAFADAAERGLTLPNPTADTCETLRSLNLDIGKLWNPMDFAPGFLSDEATPRFSRALHALLHDSNFDQLCLMLGATPAKAAPNAARALAAAAKESDKPILAFYSIPREDAPETYRLLEEARIPVFDSPARLAHAASVMAAYMDMRGRLAGSKLSLDERLAPAGLADEAGVLNESKSKALLRHFGVQCSRDVVVQAGGEIGDVGLDPPFAVKVLSPDVPHKTDVGGVELNVPDHASLRTAIEKVLRNVRQAAPGATIEAVLISEMVSGGVETLVGMVNDPVFGPTVAFGLGGILTEVVRDVSYRIAPFDRDSARGMIQEIRASSVLGGIRGGQQLDLEALVEALVNVSHLSWLMRDSLREIDINPLIVLPHGKGVVAADALVVLSPAGSSEMELPRTA